MKKKTAKKKNAGGTPATRSLVLGDLVPAGYNPRVISDEAMAGLTASLARFGCVEPIVVNCRGGKQRIVGGHQRYKVLLDMHGPKHRVPCVAVDLKPADEKLLNIALNNPHIQGEFSEDLGPLIEKIRGEIGDEGLLDLRIAELQAELAVDEKEGLKPDDEVPPVKKTSKTRPGDIYLLGDHRLMCGDSTKSEDVEQLMCGDKATLMATDPPYIVDYRGDDRPVGGKDWSATYHTIRATEAATMFEKWLGISLTVIQARSAMYLWHADRRRGFIDEVCARLGILVHQQIIWVKPCFVVTYAWYYWRHEPCIMMWRTGKKPRVKHKKYRLNTVWTVGFDLEGDPNDPAYYTDVWELDYDGKKRGTSGWHPTIKPVEIFARPMRVHTDPGDLCYEPFCGSGSQIIAAEKLSRRCYAMEIEPVFVDVAVKRWEEWTGKKAVLDRVNKARAGTPATRKPVKRRKRAKKAGRQIARGAKGGSTGGVGRKKGHTRRRGAKK